jgi:hypothetical protein
MYIYVGFEFESGDVWRWKEKRSQTQGAQWTTRHNTLLQVYIYIFFSNTHNFTLQYIHTDCSDDDEDSSFDHRLADEQIVVRTLNVEAADQRVACLACTSLVKTALKHCSLDTLVRTLRLAAEARANASQAPQ